MCGKEIFRFAKEKHNPFYQICYDPFQRNYTISFKLAIKAVFECPLTNDTRTEEGLKSVFQFKLL